MEKRTHFNRAYQSMSMPILITHFNIFILILPFSTPHLCVYCLLLLIFPNPFSLLQSQWDSFIQQAMEARTQLNNSEPKKVTTMSCLACSGMPPRMSMPFPLLYIAKGI